VSTKTQYAFFEARKFCILRTASLRSDCAPRKRKSRARAFRIAVLLAVLVGLAEAQMAILAKDTPKPENHAVAARIEAGAGDRELKLEFTVNPVIRVTPTVRWLGVGRADAQNLEVKSDSPGHYSARLGDIGNVDYGQLLIELPNTPDGRRELHSADFAFREIVTNTPSLSPSRDGRFVVYTKPEGVARGSRLLITSGELPIDALPAGLSGRPVLGMYSVDSVPSPAKMEGWQMAIAIPQGEARPAVFYLAKGAKTWKQLETGVIEGRPMLGAAIPGPGTYLLVRGGKQ
jgi:hypothetical protein